MEGTFGGHESADNNTDDQLMLNSSQDEMVKGRQRGDRNISSSLLHAQYHKEIQANRANRIMGNQSRNELLNEEVVGGIASIGSKISEITSEPVRIPDGARSLLQ
jgi:hypothetical protein